jgi:pilus assembly protein TadC
MQALEATSKELPAPICDEIRRVIQEMQIGVAMETALNNLLNRIPSEDLDFVVTSINIQREVGGNLSAILELIYFRLMDRQVTLLHSKRLGVPSLLFFILSTGSALMLHSVIFPNSFNALENYPGVGILVFSLLCVWSLILVLVFFVQMKRNSLLNEF